MRIDNKQIIGGLPALKLRDYMARYADEFLYRDHLAQYFQLSDKETDLLLKELTDENFIGKVKGDKSKFAMTLTGNAFSISRYVKPIDRIKADKIYKDFLDRVELVNREEEYLYRVSKVLLFGSYIDPQSEDFADLDIGIELQPKIEDKDLFVKMSHEQSRNAGKRFSNMLEYYYFPQTKVLQKLKNRNRYISLHMTSDDILNRTEVKQVYP